MAAKKKAPAKKAAKKTEKAKEETEAVPLAVADKIRATRQQKPRQWVVFGRVYSGDVYGEDVKDFWDQVHILKQGFKTREDAEAWASDTDNVQAGEVIYIDYITERPLCSKVTKTTSFGAL